MLKPSKRERELEPLAAGAVEALFDEAQPSAPPHLLERLRVLCMDRGLDDLARSLEQLHDLVAADLRALERELLSVRTHERVSERAGSQLLSSGGKRMRPLCVALAARVGNGFSAATLDLAVAAELIHSATLLHDDVVDLAPTRRGQVTAREEYGNAASIFAGDWLLIEALRRVHAAEIPGALTYLFDTVNQMIRAESLQLEMRGRLDTDQQTYFDIADGKSATLFRWALWAGGASGGLDRRECAALGDFGRHLGLAFQVIDDLLDLTGDAEVTGKSLFTDLREGKMTYPVIVAIEREPRIQSLVDQVIRSAAEDLEPDERLAFRLRHRLEECGAIEASRGLAERRIDRALGCLADLPDGPATQALAIVAQTSVDRRR